jgi:hypothetical protein
MKTKTQLRIIIIICFILFQVIQVHAQFLDDPGGDPGYEDVRLMGFIVAYCCWNWLCCKTN